ncbi:MAG: RnfABCDGE type electron transport complex subunit D [Intestinibacillus sp.]
MYDLSKVVVTSSPHIKSDEDTRSIMLDVIIAMIPALAVGIFTFGPRALVLTCIAVISCIVFEFAYNKLLHQEVTVGDLSAVVTGMLLAYNIPVSAPWWLPVFGSLFAIVITKMLFGGLGRNFMNPALAGRAFLMASWPGLMTTWTAVGAKLPLFGTLSGDDIKAISSATPLSVMKVATQGGATLPDASLIDALLGQIGGCLGETSALALLAGGLYLLYRKVITINIPAAYILTVAVLTFIFPLNGADRVQWMLYEVLSGGLFLGAIFMATDYTTSPVTPKGQIVFGIGCGLLTVFIRYFGGLPEGVSYSILIMNTLVWAIDKKTRPRIFGYAAKADKKKEAKA